MQVGSWTSRARIARPLAVGAVALALGAVAARAATAIDRPSVINITGRELSYRHFDEGPSGPGAGDVDVSRLSLYNRRITSRAIGHGDMLCTFLTTRSRTCTATYSLPRGRLVVGGVITSRLLYELPVLGGTGLYANARGSLVVTATSRKPRREVLVFRLQP